MGPVGMQEMVVIFIVALVLFGPKKLPELARTVGKWVSEFRRASSDLKASFEREMQDLERETEAAKLRELGQSTSQEIQSHTDFAYPYYDSGSYSPESYDNETATNQPTTVSASEVSGAESQAIEETATPVEAEAVPTVEGTVPRSEPIQHGHRTGEHECATENGQHTGEPLCASHDS